MNKLTDYDQERKKIYKQTLGDYDLRYCTECGRLFAYPGYGPNICRDCLNKDQTDFDKVREYLETHDSSLPKTAIDTGVPPKKLYQWVREERLYFKDPEGSGLYCEICGAPITTGRYCRKCKAKLMLKGVKINTDSPSDTIDEKMRFIGNSKK